MNSKEPQAIIPQVEYIILWPSKIAQSIAIAFNLRLYRPIYTIWRKN